MSDPFLEAEEADYVHRLQADKRKAETSRDNWRDFGGVVILTLLGLILSYYGIHGGGWIEPASMMGYR